MKSKQFTFTSLLNTLALVVVGLGALQLCFFIYVQTKMIASAKGVADLSNVLDFVFQQVIPPMILYIITTTGVSALLYTAGVFYKKLFLEIDELEFLDELDAASEECEACCECDELDSFTEEDAEEAAEEEAVDEEETAEEAAEEEAE